MLSVTDAGLVLALSDVEALIYSHLELEIFLASLIVASEHGNLMADARLHAP